MTDRQQAIQEYKETMKKMPAPSYEEGLQWMLNNPFCCGRCGTPISEYKNQKLIDEWIALQRYAPPGTIIEHDVSISECFYCRQKP